MSFWQSPTKIAIETEVNLDYCVFVIPPRKILTESQKRTCIGSFSIPNYHFPFPSTPEITEMFPLFRVRIWDFCVNRFHFYFLEIIPY